VRRNHRAVGVVPIENSSGGVIHETVDILLANKPRIYVEEELSLEVTLALLGRKNEKARVLYSHFAPLEHCRGWLKKHLPRVERKVVNSTAVAALWAAAENGAVALGNRRLAQLYGLDVLAYPVQADVPNLTSFIVVRGTKIAPRNPQKTSLCVRLPNEPGALCTFLDKFRHDGVNLSLIVSRPVRGCPREYAFFVDLEGGAQSPNVRRAIVAAKRVSTHFRVAGTYPCRKPYAS